MFAGVAVTVGWAGADGLALVSGTAAGAGQGDSGVNAYAGWELAPVDNAGTVVFLSSAPSLTSWPDSGTDWDVFLRRLGAAVDVVSVATPGIFPYGAAAGIAFAGDTCAEVRDDAPVTPQAQVLLWRRLSDPGRYWRLAAGSRSCSRPRLDDTGQFLVFEATDNRDVAGDDDGYRDIYLARLDLESGEGTAAIERISDRRFAPTGAGLRADCVWPDVSAAGDRVVFSSRDDGLVPGDTNGAEDIFLWAGGQLSRINHRQADQQDGLGLQTRQPCRQPVISGDGLHAFFVSADPYVVAADTNGRQDVFCLELASGRVTRISVDWLGDEGSGDCDQPDTDATGRFVVFRANAPEFPGARPGVWQVYLHDMVSAYTECVSLAPDGRGADSDCFGPALSPNGRYVTFTSAAANLPGAEGRYLQVFRVDRGDSYLNLPPVAEPVSVSCQENLGGATESVRLDLRAQDPDSAPQPLRFRLGPVSAAGGVADGALTDVAGGPVAVGALLASSRLPLAFHPRAGFAGVATVEYQAYDGVAWSRPVLVTVTVADFATGALSLESRADLLSGSQPGNGDSPPAPLFSDLSLSGDGHWLAFASDATNLVPRGWPRVTRGTAIGDAVPEPPPGRTAGPSRTHPSSSATPGCGQTENHGCVGLQNESQNGPERSEATASAERVEASPVVSGIFLRDTVQGRTYLVRGTDMPVLSSPVVSLDGTALAFTAGGQLYQYAVGAEVSLKSVSMPVLWPGHLSCRADGKLFAFETRSRLAPADTDEAVDAYLWEPDTAAFRLVSEGAGGEQTDSACSQPWLSADGRCVAFVSAGALVATEAPSAKPCVWLRYLESGHVVRLSDGTTPAAAPTLSRSGRYVAFEADSAIEVLDLARDRSQWLRLRVEDARRPALSADGRFLYFTSARPDLRESLAARQTAPAEGQRQRAGPPAVQQAYRHDLLTGERLVLSWRRTQADPAASASGGDLADADCHVGVLTTAGDGAAFASAATNLVSDATPVCHVYLKRFPASPDSPPTAAAIQVETDEDMALAAIVLAGFDPESGDIEYEVVSGPTHGTLTPIRLPEAGQAHPTIGYRPAPDFQGEDHFSYRCRDESGWSNAATVTVRVKAVNDPPVLTVARDLVLPAGTMAGVLGLNTPTGASLELSDVDDQVSDLRLEVTLAPSQGTLWDQSGQPITAGSFLTSARFPIEYRAAANEPARDQIGIRAWDKVSSSPALRLRAYIGVVARSLELEPGWNLISFPFVPAPADPVQVFGSWPGRVSPRAHLPVWEWAAAGQTQVRASALEPMVGYWVFQDGTEAVRLDVGSLPLTTLGGGEPSDALLEPGWNLVGPVAAVPAPHDEERLAGDVWGWDPGAAAYRAVPPGAWLEPGRAYWVYAGVSFRLPLGR